MSNKRDKKIDRVGSLLGPGWSHDDLTTLCRLGDTTTMPGGSLMHEEDGLTRWCYWMLSGTAVVSRDGEPLAMCGPGSLLPGGAAQRSHRAPLSVEALDDVDVVAFRVREYLGAVESIKPLRALARS